MSELNKLEKFLVEKMRYHQFENHRLFIKVNPFGARKYIMMFTTDWKSYSDLYDVVETFDEKIASNILAASWVIYNSDNLKLRNIYIILSDMYHHNGNEKLKTKYENLAKQMNYEAKT